MAGSFEHDSSVCLCFPTAHERIELCAILSSAKRKYKIICARSRDIPILHHESSLDQSNLSLGSAEITVKERKQTPILTNQMLLERTEIRTGLSKLRRTSDFCGIFSAANSKFRANTAKKA